MGCTHGLGMERLWGGREGERKGGTCEIMVFTSMSIAPVGFSLIFLLLNNRLPFSTRYLQV